MNRLVSWSSGPGHTMVFRLAKSSNRLVVWISQPVRPCHGRLHGISFLGVFHSVCLCCESTSINWQLIFLQNSSKCIVFFFYVKMHVHSLLYRVFQKHTHYLSLYYSCFLRTLSFLFFQVYYYRQHSNLINTSLQQPFPKLPYFLNVNIKNKRGYFSNKFKVHSYKSNRAFGLSKQPFQPFCAHFLAVPIATTRSLLWQRPQFISTGQ